MLKAQLFVASNKAVTVEWTERKPDCWPEIKLFSDNRKPGRK